MVWLDRGIHMLETIYWGNSLRAYMVAAGVLLAILLAVRIARSILSKRTGDLVHRIEARFDDMLAAIVGATRMWVVLVIACYAASLFLVLPPDLVLKVRTAAVVALLIQIGIWSTTVISAAVSRLREKRLAIGETAGLPNLAMIGSVGRILAWVVLFLLILGNLGVDVTALVAGLGIGGIALALAVQNVLQDVFASMSIKLDRPFEVGDTIHIDEYIGTVENIGIKTTRLRSLNGEQLVFANTDLLKSRIRNYKRMQERRVVFAVTVTVDTELALLEKLPALFRAIIERQEQARFDRAHLRGIGQYSLDFEIVYFVTSPEYVVFMDVQQRVCFEIVRELEALGVSLAFPTRTIHLAGSPPRTDDGERAA